MKSDFNWMGVSYTHPFFIIKRATTVAQDPENLSNY